MTVFPKICAMPSRVPQHRDQGRLDPGALYVAAGESHGESNILRGVEREGELQ
jgi:hypothetical protein